MVRLYKKKLIEAQSCFSLKVRKRDIVKRWSAKVAWAGKEKVIMMEERGEGGNEGKEKAEKIRERITLEKNRRGQGDLH